MTTADTYVALTNKFNYYESQYFSSISKYLQSTKRQDRDSALIYKAKASAIKEMAKEINPSLQLVSKIPE